MTITSKIKMDLAIRGPEETVCAVQDDKYSRNLEFSLYENGVAWKPPTGTAAIVRYKKSDGTGGNYDILPDDSAAYAISGNILTVALAPQVCTAAGIVRLAVGLINAGAEINTFSVKIEVQPNPGLQITSEDYYRVTGSVAESGWTPNMYLGTDALGNVVTKEAPEGGGAGLTEEQAAKLDVITITDEGYTDISGLRRLKSWEVIENGSTVTLNYTLEGEESHTDVMTFDEKGYPISIVADGFEVMGTWTVAEEAAADG